MSHICSKTTCASRYTKQYFSLQTINNQWSLSRWMTFWSILMINSLPMPLSTRHPHYGRCIEILHWSHPPLTRFRKPVEIKYTNAIGYPRISTCFMTAKFPIDFCGLQRREYLLHVTGNRQWAKAARCYMTWLLESPGYGSAWYNHLFTNVFDVICISMYQNRCISGHNGHVETKKRLMMWINWPPN